MSDLNEESNINIRTCFDGDTDAIYNLVPELSPLTQHTWYTYWNLFHNFNSSFVAEDDNAPIGFITSHPSERIQSEWFIWQAGILPEYRGTGLIDRLQDKVIEKARLAGAMGIKLTIEADNNRSFGAFSRMATKLGTTIQEYDRFNVPDSDTPEIIYRIPLGR